MSSPDFKPGTPALRSKRGYCRCKPWKLAPFTKLESKTICAWIKRRGYFFPCMRMYIPRFAFCCPVVTNLNLFHIIWYVMIDKVTQAMDCCLILSIVVCSLLVQTWPCTCHYVSLLCCKQRLPQNFVKIPWPFKSKIIWLKRY